MRLKGFLPTLIIIVLVSFSAGVWLALTASTFLSSKSQHDRGQRSAEFSDPAALSSKAFPVHCPLQSCIPPFRAIRPRWLVSRKHRLIICKIEKVMSTFLTAAVCFLKNEAAFLASNRSIHEEQWHTRLCGTSIEAFRHELNVKPADIDNTGGRKSHQYRSFAVIREPLDRFISGFLDKCIREAQSKPERCFHCSGNMSCFIEHLHRDFSQSSPKLTFEAQHFMPQTWYCDFHKLSYDIVKYGPSADDQERMRDDLAAQFEAAEASPDALRYIAAELRHKSPHKTSSDPGLRNATIRQLLADAANFNRFLEIYLFDYLFFGFQLPLRSS